MITITLAVLLSVADVRPLAMRAVAGDDRAIAQLRSMGQPGVDAMLALRGSADDARFRAALDRVCAQRDCAWSGLYWYTDLDEAKRAARESGRQILSLRMLGHLDEDLSCANSRYFRTVLYSDRNVSAYLRDHFILHWHSVRPVPVATIEMGDGRRLVRTLTGNSVHYILDADGRPLDALPGMYAPRVFLDALQHVGRSASSPTSSDTARLAVTKAIVELPILRRTSRADEVVLDENTIDLIRTKRGSAPGSLDAVLANLREAIAADTAQNESDLRPRILGMLGSVASADALDERVYREVFLTPPDDPWMGLYAENTFSAIEGEGLTPPRTASAPPPPRSDR